MEPNLKKILDDVREVVAEQHDKYDKESQEAWDSLSEEDRLKYFYQVVKRIHAGEILDPTSYRGVLYGHFEFSRAAYVVGMQCGFMELHNSIISHNPYITKPIPLMSPEESRVSLEVAKLAKEVGFDWPVTCCKIKSNVHPTYDAPPLNYNVHHEAVSVPTHGHLHQWFRVVHLQVITPPPIDHPEDTYEEAYDAVFFDKLKGLSI